MNKMISCLAAGLFCLAHRSEAQPAEWEALIDGPQFDAEVTDVATSFGQIDANSRPELVVAAASRMRNGSLQFSYRLGWNVDRAGAASRWSTAIVAPATGIRPSGIGVAVTQMDANAAPDLVLVTRDANSATADRLLYRVGWNLRADGSPASWSQPQAVNDVSLGGRGAAIAVGQLDADARPEIVVATYEPVPNAPDRLRYRIGWNVDLTGTAASWSTWRSLAGVGDSINGVSLILAALEGTPGADLLFLARSSAAQMGEFRYRIAESLNAQAVPVSWSPRYRVAGASVGAKGAAGAFADLDDPAQGARPELLFGTYDPLASGGRGAFVYRVGRNWDAAPPRLLLSHRPIHPGLTDTITYTARAEDPNGLASIEIRVNGSIVATCLTSPCAYSGRPVRDSQRGTVTYEAIARDSGGRAQSSGRREHQVGAVVPNVFPVAAVPIWVTGPVGQRIDIVFLRDRDSYPGTNGLSNFLREIASVLDRTYAADEAVGRNLGRFNFWYLTTTATAGGGCVRTVPSEYWNFGDAGAIVHADRFRDCASRGVFSSEPYEIDTFMHETGHAVFRLSDLYNGAQGLSEQSVWPNVYRTRPSCEADARLQGWPTTACVTLRHRNGTIWFRIDRGTSVMGSCGGPYPLCIDNRFAFDRGSRRRVIWYLEGLDLEPPPVSPLLRGAVVPGHSYLIEFQPVSARLTPDQQSVRIVEAEAPEEMRTDEAMLVEYLDAAGNVIATYWAEDPRIGWLIEPPIGSRVLNQPSALRLPLVSGAVQLKMTPKQIRGGRVTAAPASVVMVDLGPGIARYCGANASSIFCS